MDLNVARDDGVLGCSGISWTICKQSAPRSRQITTPIPNHSVFTDQMLFLTHNQHCQSTEGTDQTKCYQIKKLQQWHLHPKIRRRISPNTMLLHAHQHYKVAHCNNARLLPYLLTYLLLLLLLILSISAQPACCPTNSVKALKELVSQSYCKLKSEHLSFRERAFTGQTPRPVFTGPEKVEERAMHSRNEGGVKVVTIFLAVRKWRQNIA